MAVRRDVLVEAEVGFGWGHVVLTGLDVLKLCGGCGWLCAKSSPLASHTLHGHFVHKLKTHENLQD